MTEHLVLDTGYISTGKHWAERSFWNGFDSEDDWSITRQYDYYPSVGQQIPDCVHNWWESIFVISDNKKIFLYRQMKGDGNGIVVTRIVAFTNDDNFWIYCMLKYR